MQETIREFNMILYGEGKILVNRKFRVGESPDRITFSVSERDYVKDPSGQTVTDVFEGSYESLGDAKAVFRKQCQAALDKGFVKTIWI